ncbi:ABC transporter permease subunit [Streptosporangium sp. NPDC004379]|uniref:ABC transporter permease subunit n=1 Tax=Streptosporangium sp. NPDC004379 TaxID=3366189 RepID=UPI0036AF130F
MSREDAFLFEVAPYYDMRAPAKSPGRGRWEAWRRLLPAVGLVVAGLLVPLAATVVTSLTGNGGPRAYLDVVNDAQVRTALLNNAVWLVLAPVVCALGLGLAWLARGVGPRLRRLLLAALTLPVVTSPLTAGVTFRMIFAPDPGLGSVNALLPEPVLFTGPGWIWLVLGLAFVWQWTGLAFLVFHVGLANLPRDLLRVAGAFGAGPLRLLRTVAAPALFPTAAVALLIVLTAAARVFELVLVGAPGSVQPEVDVAGLLWWRRRTVLGDGRAAALAVLLTVTAVAVALAVLWRLRHDLPGAERPWRQPFQVGPAARRTRRAATARWPRRVAAGAVTALWAFPFVVLLLTSFRSPDAAATSGWWTGGYGLGSYGEAFDGGFFAEALWATAQRGLLTAFLVVPAAVSAAYALTHEALPRRARRAVTAAAVVLAVLPPQALAAPLGRALGGSLGSTFVLSLVHAALLLPLGVLLLRNAFMSVPRPATLDRFADGRSAMTRVVRDGAPAVAAVAVLSFVLVWNDMVVSLLLNWPAADQAPLTMLQASRYFTTSAGELAAQGVLMTAVPAALLLATGRWLARGLTQGIRR